MYPLRFLFCLPCAFSCPSVANQSGFSQQPNSLHACDNLFFVDLNTAQDIHNMQYHPNRYYTVSRNILQTKVLVLHVLYSDRPISEHIGSFRVLPLSKLPSNWHSKIVYKNDRCFLEMAHFETFPQALIFQAFLLMIFVWPVADIFCICPVFYILYVR